MEKLNLIVRDDWQEQQAHQVTETTHLWRVGQVVILLSTLAVFWMTLLRLPPLWNNIWRIALSWALFLTTALWSLYRRESNSLRFTVLLFAAFFVLSAAGAYWDPRVPSGISEVLPYWTIVSSLALPAASWAIILPILRRHRQGARRLGLHLSDWPVNIAIGLLSGSALALHLLFTTSFLPPEAVTRLDFSRSALFWSFSLLAGLWVPAEEILFRGLGFHVLHDVGHNTFWTSTARITLLNVLLYLVLALQNPSITLGIAIVVYRTGLSLINVFLFYRRKSLLPCMASNLIFTFTMMQLFQL